MRSFIISVIVLITVTLCVFMNIRFMRVFCTDLLTLSASVPADAENYKAGEETLRLIAQKWKEKEKLISFFTDYREVDRVNVALSDALNAFDSDDHQQYTVYFAQFRHAVKRLLDINRITAENIF